MELVLFVLLLASVTATPLVNGRPTRSAEDGDNNQSPFQKVIRTTDITAQDVIYSTPKLVYVGTTTGKLLRCLQEQPDECEEVFTDSKSVQSLDIRGEYIYVGVYGGQIVRCPLHKKESCAVFQSTGSKSVDSVATAGQYLYAGLENGTVLRCEQDPNSCESFHTVGARVWSLHKVNDYLYAGLQAGPLLRCSLLTKNSCTQAYHMNSTIMGITKIGNSLVVITWNKKIWNCSLKASDMINDCTTVSVNHDKPADLALFNGNLFTLGFKKAIYTCKLENNSDCTNYMNIKDARSMAFAYGTYQMQSRYRNEKTICTWQSSFMCPPHVVYYDEKERAALEVHVKDGKLYNSLGYLVDTTNADEGRSGTAAIFVMGPGGRLLLSYMHKKGLLHSSSLLAGNPVSGAGQIVVKNGAIAKLVACSDHYRPDRNLNLQVVQSLRTQGYTDPIDLEMCGDNNPNLNQIVVN